MSAIADPGDRTQPIQVLVALHSGFDTLDALGPLEVLNYARHDVSDFKNDALKAFNTLTCAQESHVVSAQKISIKVDMDFDEAMDRLDEFDILLIPGGSTDDAIKNEAQPIPLIKAWSQLQIDDPSRERTLFSVCTGSLFLAKAGVLQGLSATTHPNYYTTLEILCQEAAKKDSLNQTDVMEERYVVNNARFDLGENIEENPFLHNKPPPSRPWKSANCRKGSDAWKLSRRRESLLRRGSLPLGGLRVITSGGITTGLDATLYLVAALVSIDSATQVAEFMQYAWQKGITVDAVDV